MTRTPQRTWNHQPPVPIPLLIRGAPNPSARLSPCSPLWRGSPQWRRRWRSARPWNFSPGDGAVLWGSKKAGAERKNPGMWRNPGTGEGTIDPWKRQNTRDLTTGTYKYMFQRIGLMENLQEIIMISCYVSPIIQFVLPENARAFNGSSRLVFHHPRHIVERKHIHETTKQMYFVYNNKGEIQPPTSLAPTIIACPTPTTQHQPQA